MGDVAMTAKTGTKTTDYGSRLEHSRKQDRESTNHKNTRENIIVDSSHDCYIEGPNNFPFKWNFKFAIKAFEIKTDDNGDVSVERHGTAREKMFVHYETVRLVTPFIN